MKETQAPHFLHVCHAPVACVHGQVTCVHGQVAVDKRVKKTEDEAGLKETYTTQTPLRQQKYYRDV